MNKLKKIIAISAIIGLSSQIYMDFLVSNFRISFAPILFPLFLLLYSDLNFIVLGITSGLSVQVWRSLVYYLKYGLNDEIFILYFPEVAFYIFYGLLLKIFVKKETYNNFNKLFFIMVLGDFFSNLLEILIRLSITPNDDLVKIILSLFFVAVVRASVVWIILNVHKYYKILLIKEEHEKRYRKLVWMTSRLRTEMYWMEKNMDNIEEVMANAYNLFENITQDKDKESWASTSVQIAKDVHEIKKEYSLVLRGVKEITENKIQDNGMYFNELVIILKESMVGHIKYNGENIDIYFKGKENFYTTKHYYLMSIFRNIIMNSIDSIGKDSTIKGEIVFNYIRKSEDYIFEIIDNGCGIDKDDMDYIFTPGFSTKIDYETGEVNRGLGLSLVESIVEQKLKGKIYVTSKKGEGTSFKVEIPAHVLEG